MHQTKLSDIFGPIEIQKAFLSVTGCWPKRNASFAYRSRNYLCWALDLSMQVFLFWELYKNFQYKEYKAMTELLSFMASEVPYLFKHLTIDLNRDRFLNALERLEHPIFNRYPKKCDIYVLNANRTARIIARFYHFIVLNLVLIFFLKPWFTQDQTALRFSVFDLGKGVWPFHIYQVIAVGQACYNNSTLDLLSLGIISMGSAQFEILRDKIIYSRQWAGLSNEDIDSGRENPEREMDPVLDAKHNKYLGECVKHHLGILRFAADIENVFSIYFLIQFADSVAAICNTWFQFMLEDKIIKIMFLVFYIITLLTQLGMYCIYGNNLMLKSEELRDACYNSNWYTSGHKVRTSLILVMERSKRATILTAGKFSVLNLATYVGLLRMSYSYFALMNQMYGK